MSKLFIYNVNGTILEDNEAFGSAWAQAKEIAKAEHTAITRQVICGDSIKNEFYADGGIFLDEKFMDEVKVRVF